MVNPIITKGFGPNQMIITQGYGLWEKIKEVVEEIVRGIPVEWRHKKFEITVLGDVVFPEEKTLILLGDLVIKLQKIIGIRGKLDQTELMMWLLSEEDEKPLSEDLTDREKMLAMKEKLLKELKEDAQKKKKMEAAISIAQKIKEISVLIDQLEKARTEKDAKKIGEIADRLEEIINDEEEA